MYTPNTNGNGMILEDMMTYEDMEIILSESRDEAIAILTNMRIDAYIANNGIAKSLRIMLELNGLYKEDEYYERGNEEMYNELYDRIMGAYYSMSNKEIIEWYKENEPLVFGAKEELERMFAL